MQYSVHELTVRRDELDRQIKAARKQEAVAALENIHEIVALYGLTPQDIYPPARKITVRKRTAVPKYRDPLTGGTWSGHGRPPVWIKGQDTSKFLIHQG